jgi:hypothetical protein
VPTPAAGALLGARPVAGAFSTLGRIFGMMRDAGDTCASDATVASQPSMQPPMQHGHQAEQESAWPSRFEGLAC